MQWPGKTAAVVAVLLPLAAARHRHRHRYCHPTPLWNRVPSMPGKDEDQALTSNPPGLPVDAGLCGACRYASVKTTHRNTTYLRCTRAAWDDRLARYPRLPVSACAGFSAGE